jgi:hypothetical protein
MSASSQSVVVGSQGYVRKEWTASDGRVILVEYEFPSGIVLEAWTFIRFYVVLGP